jgi:lipopolysaccharide export LptBFGC system permease protein LptF
MPLRVIYSIFIAILFATLVGVGIAAFYPGPKAPEYPVELTRVSETATPAPGVESEEFKREQRDFEQKQRAYQSAAETYSRNVSLIALAASVLALVVSLTLFRRIMLIADGLLLGGLFTLIYSIGRGFGSGDDVFRFIVTTVGFLVAVTLGYLKFVYHEKPKKRRKR